MSRTLTALATAALLTVTAAGTAAAVVPPEDRVLRSNLPTVAQVAASYPGLHDGHRYVQSDRTTSTRGTDCLSWVAGPQAASGKWAFYTDAADQSPYFSGQADPVVFVWKYATLAGAKSAFTAIWGANRACFGTAGDGDLTVESHRVAVPDLAARSRAWRTHETQAVSDDHFLTQLTRKGRYLVETRVQAPGFVPAKAPLVALTRTTLRRLP
jgi:hypothetical protein